MQLPANRGNSLPHQSRQLLTAPIVSTRRRARRRRLHRNFRSASSPLPLWLNSCTAVTIRKSCGARPVIYDLACTLTSSNHTISEYLRTAAQQPQDLAFPAPGAAAPAVHDVLATRISMSPTPSARDPRPWLAIPAPGSQNPALGSQTPALGAQNPGLGSQARSSVRSPACRLEAPPHPSKPCPRPRRPGVARPGGGRRPRGPGQT